MISINFNTECERIQYAVWKKAAYVELLQWPELFDVTTAS